MLDAKRQSSRFVAVWAACLIALVPTLPGCQPEGAGSIKMGSPSQWHKEPEAPSPRSKSKKVTSTNTEGEARRPGAFQNDQGPDARAKF